jgi:hypothetical protein
MNKKTNPSTTLGASRKIEKEKGLAILYSVIVSIIMLSVATSISSIALRQTKLSSTGRESQYAFFAANTGIECARYLDLQNFADDKPAFATSSNSASTIINLTCNDQPLSVNFNSSESSPTNGVTDFQFTLEPEADREYLVKVKVSKTATSTLITSRGFNTADTNAPNAVQRGLEMFYGF